MSQSRLAEALRLLGELIRDVEALPTGNASGQAVSSVKADLAWGPNVPSGHTGYSWGTNEAPAGSDPETKQAPPQPQQPQQPQQPKQQNNDQQKPKAEQQNDQQKPKADQQKGQKQQNQPKGGKPAAAKEEENKTPPFYRLDIRVGKIVKAWKHPEADSLYIEQIDLGEAEPRQVVSGLYAHIPHSEFEGSDVLVIVNLKPAPLRNVTSYGMVLAASNEDRTKIELVKPPVGTPVGVRVYLDGDKDDHEWVADLSVNGKDKASAWAKVAPELATDVNGVATYQGRALRVNDGPLKAPTLTCSKVS